MTRLRELGKEFNISQDQYLEIVGLSRNIIANLINERKLMDSELIVSFCKLFNVTADYFLGITEYGIYIKLNDNKYTISKHQLDYYAKKKLITYDGFTRILNANINDIEFVEGNAQLIKLKNEIL